MSSSPFSQWLEDMKSANGGKKTTLKLEFQLALDLYQQTYPNNEQQETAEEVIKMVKNTPIHDTRSIVSWTGIKVDWFLNVFCKSPFIKLLIEYGCEVWFIRKICVIEMVRQTVQAKMPQGKQLNGTFVDNIDSVVKGWNLKGGKDITAKPTTFISYTGAYTMGHVVQVLANLNPQQYIWMDIFCVDQFAWTGKKDSPEMLRFRDKFIDDLQNQIKAIGNTALILEKWDNVMLTLGKMWVLWEIFNTAQAKVHLEVLLTPEQRERFIANCLEDAKAFDSIQLSLAKINANNAVTEDDNDRKYILERMQREDDNLTQVNSSVLGVMRDWLAQEGLQHLSSAQFNGQTPSATSLNNMGLLLKHQGRLNEAEPLMRKALEISLKMMGDRHHTTLTSINNLGTLLQAKGKLNEAEPFMREALKTRRQVLGDHHHCTLSSINNLGSLLQAQGKLNEAESLYREAMETRKQVLGEEHQDTVTSISNLGLLLKYQGKLNEAEPLLKEALETSRQMLGGRHPDTLTSINNMGVLLQAQGKLNEAEPLLREALDIRREVLGRWHPSALTSTKNLFALLQAQGKLNEAEPLIREALDISRQVLGDRHQDTLGSINNLGLLLHSQGQLNEAEPFMREALKTRREVLGDHHQDTLGSINNLGTLLQAQNKLDEAEQLLREALDTS